MNDCIAGAPRLDAYIDGELSEAEVLAIRQHLQSCPTCREAEALQRRFLAMVRIAAAGSPSLPRGLEEGVRASLHSARFTHGRLVRSIAIAATVVLVCTGVIVRFVVRDRAAAPLIAAATTSIRSIAVIATNEHVARLQRSAPLEVETSDARVLAHWAQTRVPFGVVLPAFDNPSLEAVGARITRVGTEPALSAAYRLDGQPVTLLVTGSVIDPAENASGESFRGLRFHLGYERGFRTITWADKGLSYVLVSALGDDGRQACSICHGPGSGRNSVHEFWE